MLAAKGINPKKGLTFGEWRSRVAPVFYRIAIVSYVLIIALYDIYRFLRGAVLPRRRKTCRVPTQIHRPCECNFNGSKERSR